MMPKVPHLRYLVGLTILVSLALLVWFVAPLIGPKDQPHLFDPSWARWLVIATIFVAWGGVEMGLAWRVRQRSGRLAEDISEDQQNASLSAQESAVLKERFNAAMAALKKARFANVSGTKALYVLPWYVFVGAPGSGKTTALLQSGLRFPLAKSGEAAAALSGVGGTRNCDWWFTDKAVLIDTAGRYVTQSSNAKVDQSAWRAFLALLKRFRPRQPINGILVTLSVGDLLTDSPQERAEYAQSVRLRVQELQRDLGLQFPIYLLVTKCDLLSGFTQFFSDFEADLREQVWGSTFNIDLKIRKGEDPRSAFQRDFPKLTQRVNDLLFRRLQEERDGERRALMYAFPQELAALEPLVSEFLDIAFEDSQLQDQTLVRGVYFVSGTQHGAPIDRVLKSLEKSLNLNNPQPRTAASLSGAKAFFIHRLLTEVVIPEAPLAGFNERRERLLRRLNIGLLAGSALLTAGLAAMLTISYANNNDALKLTQSEVALVKKEMADVDPGGPGDLERLLQALTDLKAIPGKHHYVDSPPLAMRFGLFHGDDLADAVEQRYVESLKRGLLPMLAQRLELIMGRAQFHPREAYSALKLYVMLYEPTRLDKKWFATTATALLSGNLKSSEDHDAVARHLRALLDLPRLDAKAARPRNEAVQRTARDAVAGIPVEERAYAELLATVTSLPKEGIRLSDIAGSSVLERRGSSQTLSTLLPYAFTRVGYQEAIKPRVMSIAFDIVGSDPWVLGHGGLRSATAEDVALLVLQRYASEFVALWTNALNEIHVRRLNGIADAAAVAGALSSPDSPLAKVVLFADDEARLGSLTTGNASGAASSPRPVVDGLSSGTVAIRVREIENRVDDRLGDLHKLAADVRLKGESVKAFKDIAAALFQIQTIAQQGVAAGAGEAQTRLRNVVSQARTLAPPWSNAVADVAAVGDAEAAGVVQNQTKVGLGGATAYCSRVTPNKYPFVRHSNDDIGLQDFTTIFQPDGEIDAFFKSQLANFVDTSGDQWRLRGSGPGVPTLKPQALQQFRNADRIRRAFFRRDTPAIAADVSVVSGDGEVTLEYGGTATRLRAGAPGVQIAWPVAQSGARLSASGQILAQAEGPWALFRLIDRGAPEGGGTSSSVRVSYPSRSGGRFFVEFRAQTSDPYNPFRLTAVRDFACPRD